MTSLVTVVIPTFNRARLLSRAIQSAIAQSVQPTEIIIVDDGSTDDTRDIVRAFGDQVIYLHQDNRERSAARNAGIAAAQGDYIAFLDSDDYWAPRHLEKLICALDANRAAVCAYSSWYLVDEVGRVLDVKARGATPTTLRTVILDAAVLTSASMVRRELLTARDLFPLGLSIAEDWIFFSRLAAQHPFEYSPTATAFEVHHEGRSLRNVALTLRERPRALALARVDEVLQQKAASYLPAAEARFELASSADLLSVGRMREARLVLTRAKALDPTITSDPRFRLILLRSFLGPRISRAITLVMAWYRRTTKIAVPR